MSAIDKIHIPPGLWRTFRDYAQTWRHRPAVIYGLMKYIFPMVSYYFLSIDWAQLTCVLASTVVHKLWWPDLIPLQYNCK